MTTKINPAEEKRIIAKWRDEAMRIGTCTDPANRPEVERLITLLYEHAGRKHPNFYWFDGPMSASVAIGKEDPQYAKTVAPCFYGGENQYWIAVFNAGQELGAVYKEKDLELKVIWDALSRAGGWWWPFEEGVVCADRPKTIKMENNVLHCADGPAIECRDGHKVFAWRGTRIPGEWIAPSFRPKLASLALTHPNLEQRRCAAEIVGWIHVLEAVGYSTIDKDPNPEIGHLVEVQLPDAEGRERFLIVRCPTGRTFALGVGLDAKTAREANASTYRMAADDYRPEFRT